MITPTVIVWSVTPKGILKYFCLEASATLNNAQFQFVFKDSNQRFLNTKEIFNLKIICEYVQFFKTEYLNQQDFFRKYVTKYRDHLNLKEITV